MKTVYQLEVLGPKGWALTYKCANGRYFVTLAEAESQIAKNRETMNAEWRVVTADLEDN